MLVYGPRASQEDPDIAVKTQIMLQKIESRPRVPAEAVSLLDKMTNHIPVILGRNLVGIYLYGSITNSSFNPHRSDIDCLAVTRISLSENQFRRLRAWLENMAKTNSWTTRLQMSFLVKNQLLVSSVPSNLTSCLYQFGKLQRCGSDGNPIIWLDHLRVGETLVGPAATSFLPEITEELLNAALQREIDYLRDELGNPESKWRDLPMYRAYATLTICRILYTRAKGSVVSKPMAARWALKRLPVRFHGLIEKALDYNKTARDVQIPLRSLRGLLNVTQLNRHYTEGIR